MVSLQMALSPRQTLGSMSLTENIQVILNAVKGLLCYPMSISIFIYLN